VSHNEFNIGGEAATTPNDFYNTSQRSASYQNHLNSYNPLHGVPFELNPIYNLKKSGQLNNLVRKLIIIKANFQIF
jgi:hypothetical protein